MELFDVVIVGAGPAGLRCAEMLQPSGLSVLILEKNGAIGAKICAGGITRKFFNIYDPPQEILEFKSNQTLVTSDNSEFLIQNTEPFIYTLNRKAFGQWQAARITASSVQIRTGMLVTQIGKQAIEVNRNHKIGFRYLVGADGPNSIVRRYLKLPSRKRIITLQYTVPSENEKKFEVHIKKRLFGVGYGWVFPHGSYFTVGCGMSAGSMTPGQLKKNFHQWLIETEIKTNGARIESFPILYDYQGYQFGNFYLAGEAAGFTSGLTGEGIYPALASGTAIAQHILNNKSAKEQIDEVIQHKKTQERYLSLFQHAGFLGNTLIRATISLLHTDSIKKYILKGFS
ncbi:MAG: NAD(P)/FAD-dependent oxidoreductase [Bacteroidales bacterium]|nr:NAD(P)/FAD-dependent oxidoreductase [Bacteroidales bacterium]